MAKLNQKKAPTLNEFQTYFWANYVRVNGEMICF